MSRLGQFIQHSPVNAAAGSAHCINRWLLRAIVAALIYSRSTLTGVPMSHSWLFDTSVSASAATSLSIQRRADEIAAEMFARAEKRRLAFADLRSEFASPADRISAWERLHGLRLPSNSGHAILLSVSQSTGLTLDQIRDEQGSRNERSASRASSTSVYG